MSVSEEQQQQQLNETPIKILTRLLSEPSNRCCADCRTTLVDLNQTYASFSPKHGSAAYLNKPRYDTFAFNHEQFAPPGYRQTSKSKNDESSTNGCNNQTSEYSSLADPCWAAPFGVFICVACASAHKILGSDICTVNSVQDQAAWTLDSIQLLQAGGGNARSWQLLEAYMPAQWRMNMKPIATSTIAERLTFVRAKYEVLAFSTPPAGPFAPQAWKNIMAKHPEWSKLWGDMNPSLRELQIYGSMNDKSFAKLLPGKNNDSGLELPNRLVDWFCVVSPSEVLDPSLKVAAKNIETASTFALLPSVTSCYPSQDAYPDTEFPIHVGSFVSPEGCRPSLTPDAPSFFTFVLTTSDGSRLYGGALTLHDTSSDVSFLRKAWKSSRPKDSMPEWLNDDITQNTTDFDRETSDNTVDVIYLPKVLVVMSHYPFFDLWRKFLLQIYRIALVEAPLPIERFIANFCSEVPLPPPGRIQVKFAFTVKEPWLISRPPSNQLPLANFSFKPLFASLSIGNVLLVFACLLQENRVALLSSHYSLLGPVAEALISIIFPFHWQGIFLPVMPYTMLDVLDAPVPFLVGLNSRYLIECNPTKRPRGVVYVDLDKDIVHLGYDDNGQDERMTPALPERLAQKLKTRLDACAASAYIMPVSGKAGSITTGSGRPLSYANRCSYTHINSAEVPNNTLRRKQLFMNADKAYRDNDFLIPLTGFLSEHGQFHAQDVVSPTVSAPKSRTSNMNPFRRNRNSSFGHSRRRTFGDASDSSLMADVAKEAETIERNLLDVENYVDIRDAFLKFFITLFKDYREYVDEDEEEFDSTAFLENISLTPQEMNFMQSLLKTQMFSRFIEDRLGDPVEFDSEVLFFEESINEKYNRMRKMTLNLTAKRSTKFLDDTSNAISETYTPPPPSNWGLPEDKKYHYGCFPTLDEDLFGKVRPPVKWPVDKKDTMKALRKATTTAQANELAIIHKAMRPLIDTPTALLSATKRNMPTLEVAIGALSLPFAAPLASPMFVPRPRQSPPSMNMFKRDESSFLSEEGVEVTTENNDLAPEVVDAAERILHNARLKQVILFTIIVKLQSVCRMFLAKKIVSIMREESLHDQLKLERSDSQGGFTYKQKMAAIMIQSRLRVLYFRVMFTRLRRATICIQSTYRGRRVRFAYTLFQIALRKLQARCRGHVVKLLLAKAIKQRLALYCRYIFMLWTHTYTPLSYRTKFWPLLDVSGLVRLAIAEVEIKRLWHVSRDSASNGKVRVDHDKSDYGVRLGMRSDVYFQCVQKFKAMKQSSQQPAISQSVPIIKNGSTDNSSDSVMRILAERTQIYDRLTFLESDILTRLYNEFGLDHKLDNKKKLYMSEEIWRSLETVDASLSVMLQLFPELQDSTNIQYREPSKKGLRRLKSMRAVMTPLSRDLWAHTFLDNRIRRNVSEVASAGLLRVPTLTMLIAKPFRQLSPQQTRQQQAIAGTYSDLSWERCEIELLRQYFCITPGKLATKIDDALQKRKTQQYTEYMPEMPKNTSPASDASKSRGSILKMSLRTVKSQE